MTDDPEPDRKAHALLDLAGSGGQRSEIAVPDMASAGRIVARIRALREARGERVVGRKIGFSNSTIWPLCGVDRPIWNHLWDSTMRHAPDAEARLDLTGLAGPRIEPEVVLHLSRAPEPDMGESDLLACVDRVAHGIEIVQSVFPGWKFTAADSCAAFGPHGALVVGPWCVEKGDARNVLDGGPVTALRYPVVTIHHHPEGRPLAAGEIVTTRLDGIGLAGLRPDF